MSNKPLTSAVPQRNLFETANYQRFQLVYAQMDSPLALYANLQSVLNDFRHRYGDAFCHCTRPEILLSERAREGRFIRMKRPFDKGRN
jgi:hypothetical protein